MFLFNQQALTSKQNLYITFWTVLFTSSVTVQDNKMYRNESYQQGDERVS